MYNSHETGKHGKFGKLQNNQQYRERSKKVGSDKKKGWTAMAGFTFQRTTVHH